MAGKWKTSESTIIPLPKFVTVIWGNSEKTNADRPLETGFPPEDAKQNPSKRNANLSDVTLIKKTAPELACGRGGAV